MKNLLAVFTVLLMTFSLSAQIDFETSTWSEVLAKAKKENKIIFVDGYAVWCGPCKWMAKNVFTDPSVAEYYNKTFINVKMDLEKGEGKDFAKKYGVAGYPTLYFINGDGELLHQNLGGLKVEQFIALGKDASDPNKQVFSLRKKYNSGNATDVDVVNYMNAIKASGKDVDETILATFFKGKDLHSKENMEYILKYATPTLQSDFFIEILKHKKSYVTEFGEDTIDSSLRAAAEYDGQQQGISPKDKETLLKHFKKYLDEDKAKISTDRTYVRALMYSNDPADSDKFIAESQLALADEPDFDFSFYNSVAWELHTKTDDTDLLVKALRWADISIEKQKEYFNLDTKASILYKLKRKEAAIKAANDAIAFGQEKGADVTETERLLEKINKL